MQPKLDHLIQRKVEVVTREDGGWEIEFEGGTVVANHQRSKKPEVEGFILTDVDEGEKEFQMTFKQGVNTEQVVVTKGQFSIDGEDPFDDEEESLPVDPSIERIQDKPEDGFPEPMSEEEKEKWDRQAKGVTDSDPGDEIDNAD